MTSTISLEYFADNWNGHSKKNVEELGEAWPIASTMVDLHASVLKLPTDYVGMTKATMDAITLLGVHGLNLFISCMSLTARGQFDVVPYLFRSIADCQLLLLACGCDEMFADRFLSGKTKASEGRAFQVDILKRDEPEIADFIDRRLKRELGAAANNLAHVSIKTASKLLDPVSLQPLIGGRNSGEDARAMAAGIMEHEAWQLAWLRLFKGASLEERWVERADANRAAFHHWLESTFGPGPLADDLPPKMRRQKQ